MISEEKIRMITTSELVAIIDELITAGRWLSNDIGITHADPARKSCAQHQWDAVSDKAWKAISQIKQGGER